MENKEVTLKKVLRDIAEHDWTRKTTSNKPLVEKPLHEHSHKQQKQANQSKEGREELVKVLRSMFDNENDYEGALQFIRGCDNAEEKRFYEKEFFEQITKIALHSKNVILKERAQKMILDPELLDEIIEGNNGTKQLEVILNEMLKGNNETEQIRVIQLIQRSDGETQSNLMDLDGVLSNICNLAYESENIVVREKAMEMMKDPEIKSSSVQLIE